jgi:hypothetical protein
VDVRVQKQKQYSLKQVKFMAIAGHIALSFKELKCLDDTNEVGKDEIIFYSILVIRDPVNRKIIRGISKSQLFNNIDKGSVRTNNLVLRSGVQVGHDCLTLEQGNLLNISFNHEAPDEQRTTQAFSHANNNYALFVLMTEHDDSNTDTILNEIRNRVNTVVSNTNQIFAATPQEFRRSIGTAIDEAFKSAKKTSALKNDDDKIQIQNCLPENLILNGFPGSIFSLTPTIPFTGDGGRFELKITLHMVIRYFNSSITPPICF